MSNAETLRRAAKLMRERAEAARAGRWLPGEEGEVLADWQDGPRYIGICNGPLAEGNAANAAHIASWHPAVALAVADWLDDHAETAELFVAKEIPASAWSMNWQTSHNHALAVARAYLGATP